MSLEIHTFLQSEPPSLAALQQELVELGFSFSFLSLTDSLLGCRGFMPMTYGSEQTGVEIFTSADQDEIREILDGELDESFAYIVSFRWSSDFREMTVAYCLAAALARVANGVFFDAEEGAFYKPDETVEIARRMLAEVEEMRRADAARES